ncbi:hypothetical protein [Mesorhizobium sp. BE184]|uniref:hypothetical protein n=1 Tax=Mesorhizobium sp. BE184 TaxID=2817714 RepID=UPI00285B286B|nr:hypothetical protein [Mesorhizobium sp. BE184]MDR7032932.1 uncharacterized protein (UPF0333 family) [Mesorhizobium sp. BE184]
METSFKVLIAAACVVIIAAGGYYFWGEYQESMRVQAAKAAASETAAMERDAARKAADEAVIADCKRRVPSASTDNLKALYEQCLADSRKLNLTN